MEISYRYTLRVTDKTSIEEAIDRIEEENLKAGTDELIVCEQSSGRRLNTVVGLSAMPEDRVTASCGEGCVDIDGGMTVYLADEGNSDTTGTQCRVFGVIQDSMGKFESDSDGMRIDELSMTDNDGLDCQDSRGGVPAGAISSSLEDGDGFPVAAVAWAAVGIALLALLACLCLRRRKSNGNDPNTDEEVNLNETDLHSMNPDWTVDQTSQSVHRCTSSSCHICRKAKEHEPIFISTAQVL